jgi:hypothetical protein
MKRVRVLQKMELLVSVAVKMKKNSIVSLSLSVN